MKKHTAPIIAAVLLLLPMLYVGSYLALRQVVGYEQYGRVGWVDVRYKFCGHWGNSFFWPLEQIDRKVRPGAWEAKLLPWELGVDSRSGVSSKRMEWDSPSTSRAN